MAELLLLVIGAYCTLGVAFAAPFLARGIRTLDPGVKGAPAAFYLFVLPGVVALWPVMLRAWLRARSRS